MSKTFNPHKVKLFRTAFYDKNRIMDVKKSTNKYDDDGRL